MFAKQPIIDLVQMRSSLRAASDETMPYDCTREWWLQRHVGYPCASALQPHMRRCTHARTQPAPFCMQVGSLGRTFGRVCGVGCRRTRSSTVPRTKTHTPMMSECASHPSPNQLQALARPMLSLPLPMQYLIVGISEAAVTVHHPLRMQSAHCMPQSSMCMQTPSKWPATYASAVTAACNSQG